MRQPRTLHNTTGHELWPAWLLRARRSDDARVIATAQWVLREKSGGRYLAAVTPTGELRTLPSLPNPRITGHVMDTLLRAAASTYRDGVLPLHRLQSRLDALGIDADTYATQTGLPLTPEPRQLHLAGFDRYRRALWLRAPAARAWHAMQACALRDGIVLEAISGYRSHAYQLGIFERKLARGLSVTDILRVNAAPGFSEHHGGCALDIGSPDEPPAEESFERTPAFAWLQRNAADHGFAMSYPRGNPHGIDYEPWHWCWHAHT